MVNIVFFLIHVSSDLHVSDYLLDLLNVYKTNVIRQYSLISSPLIVSTLTPSSPLHSPPASLHLTWQHHSHQLSYNYGLWISPPSHQSTVKATWLQKLSLPCSWARSSDDPPDTQPASRSQQSWNKTRYFHLLFQVTCSRCSFPPCPACTLVYHCSCPPVCTLPAAEVDADLARSPLMPWSRYRNHLNKKHLCKSMIISILNSLNAVYISRVRVRSPWRSEACCLSKNYS